MELLDKEIQELKGFIADLKADRAAQKEKEKREGWTKYTSMSLVFIAVLAAVATTLSGKYSGGTMVQLNKATFFQSQASDKWSEFQANSIKRNLYETVHDTTFKEAAADSAEAAKREDIFKAKLKKYDDNKQRLTDEAKALENKCKEAQDNAARSTQHGGRMGTVVSIFQISIAMGSICLVAKKKWLWYVSMSLATAATALMIYVWST